MDQPGGNYVSQRGAKCIIESCAIYVELTCQIITGVIRRTIHNYKTRWLKQGTLMLINQTISASWLVQYGIELYNREANGLTLWGIEMSNYNAAFKARRGRSMARWQVEYCILAWQQYGTSNIMHTCQIYGRALGRNTEKQ